MVAAGGHHQQHVPPLQLNGVLARLPRLPQGRCRLQRHLIVLLRAEEATEVAPRDVLAVGGEHLGVGGDIGVGELGPTPHTHHDDAARRHWVEVPNLRDTLGEGGWNFLKRGPPTPDPKELLLCRRRGSSGSLALSSLRAALKSSSKFFETTFLSPLPHAFITLFHPTSQSRASTSPQSTM